MSETYSQKNEGQHGCLDVEMHLEATHEEQAQVAAVPIKAFENLRKCKNFRSLFEVIEEPKPVKMQRINAFESYQQPTSLFLQTKDEAESQCTLPPRALEQEAIKFL